MLYSYKSLTKINYHELTILYYRRYPNNRMGIRIFCSRRWWIDPHITGNRNHFINTWFIAQAYRSLITAPLN